jgi:YadA-like membrane anchor domain
MFGTAANTYVMPGIASAASRAAQSGPTQFVTSDAAGNLATANFGLQDIAVLNANVAGLQQSVVVLQQGVQQAFEGTAIAIALGGSALPSDKRFAITSNWGNFRGQNALSLIAQARVNDFLVLNAGFAGGLQQQGIGSRVGATFAW